MEKNLKLNAIWNTLGITVNSFNSLFFLIIINRVNGVEIAGIFSFAFSIACLLFIVGIYAGRTYQVSDINENLNNYEYLVHKYITCTMMFLIAIVFIIVQKYSLEKNVIIILLCLYKLFEAMSETFYGFLQKNDELYIVEIKTESTHKYNRHTDAWSEHKLQATCYSMTIGVPKVLFIYEDRDNCTKKGYLVEITDLMKTRVQSIIDCVNTFIENQEVPPRELDKCKYCKYQNQCRKDGE